MTKSQRNGLIKWVIVFGSLYDLSEGRHVLDSLEDFWPSCDQKYNFPQGKGEFHWPNHIFHFKITLFRERVKPNPAEVTRGSCDPLPPSVHAIIPMFPILSLKQLFSRDTRQAQGEERHPGTLSRGDLEGTPVWSFGRHYPISPGALIPDNYWKQSITRLARHALQGGSSLSCSSGFLIFFFNSKSFTVILR